MDEIAHSTFFGMNPETHQCYLKERLFPKSEGSALFPWPAPPIPIGVRLVLVTT